MKLRRPFSAAIVILTMAAPTFAQQGRFTIQGRLKVEGGGLEGARMVVFRNGQEDRVFTNNLSKFTLDLDLNQTYVINFEKDGFVTKKLSFDTHAPAAAAANGFTPFEFAVSIFKQYDDVNTVVFNQPVGMIRFDPGMDDFDYDTDYTKSIQSQLQKTMEEVARKQQEEAANADADAARKKEEEKEKGRLEEEERRKAADRVKLEAKQQKDREEAEKKAEAEGRKAELAAKQAEAAKPKPKPVPPAPPVKEATKPKPPPVVKAEVPKPRPAPRVVEVTSTDARPTEGSDGRRSLKANEGNEESPIRPAAPVLKEEERPEARPVIVESVREEELIVEPNQVITLIKLATDAQKNEYRKVVRKYGGTFYFKNGLPCSQLLYESEALADHK
jgi:flagellar biosynthesis GTPase FlhF